MVGVVQAGLGVVESCCRQWCGADGDGREAFFFCFGRASYPRKETGTSETGTSETSGAVVVVSSSVSSTCLCNFVSILMEC